MIRIGMMTIQRLLQSRLITLEQQLFIFSNAITFVNDGLMWPRVTSVLTLNKTWLVCSLIVVNVLYLDSAEALVYRLSEKTHVQEVMSSNPSTGYWMGIFHINLYCLIDKRPGMAF